MNDGLTKKQRGFVKDYLKTGIGSLAAKENYDVANDNVARNIASENLTKPNIQKAIADRLTDELLSEKHIELFNQKRIDYFMFPKSMDDEEIREHVESVGITVITVRTTEKGKMAFYSLPDANAIKGALDMAYKIKSTYAPEKSVNVNVEVEASPVIKELTDKLNGLYRGSSESSDGGITSVVDPEAQD